MRRTDESQGSVSAHKAAAVGARPPTPSVRACVLCTCVSVEYYGMALLFLWERKLDTLGFLNQLRHLLVSGDGFRSHMRDTRRCARGQSATSLSTSQTPVTSFHILPSRGTPAAELEPCSVYFSSVTKDVCGREIKESSPGQVTSRCRLNGG